MTKRPAAQATTGTASRPAVALPAATRRSRRAAPAAAPAAAAPATAASPIAAVRGEWRRPSGGQIVQLLDEDDPIGALRGFLAAIDGDLTIQQGQIALGAAQLMLLPIEREHRGGAEVQELIDLVLSRWPSLPEPSGFHAQGFLRNAFTAVGDDPERIARLIELVPDDPSPELRYNIACAYAYVGDTQAMREAVRAALDAGASATQFRRETDFIAYFDDPVFTALLDSASRSPHASAIAPYVAPVRAALDALVSALRELGQPGTLNAPASLDSVLSVERAERIQLPDDYRALLTMANGMKVWDSEFLGTRDYRGDTPLARRARAFLADDVGLESCVPIASWGQPPGWLLYDPRGQLRGGVPGYVLLGARGEWVDDLVAALERVEQVARDELGTN